MINAISAFDAWRGINHETLNLTEFKLRSISEKPVAWVCSFTICYPFSEMENSYASLKLC
jgi:hypothetical protein